MKRTNISKGEYEELVSLIEQIQKTITIFIYVLDNIKSLGNELKNKVEQKHPDFSEF
jgi:hypothetical protein